VHCEGLRLPPRRRGRNPERILPKSHDLITRRMEREGETASSFTSFIKNKIVCEIAAAKNTIHAFCALRLLSSRLIS